LQQGIGGNESKTVFLNSKRNMKGKRPIGFILILILSICIISGCSNQKAFSSTYHARFFGLYKPKAKKASTPQSAFATGFRGVDPFARRKKSNRYNVAGDGYHTIVRHMRKQNSMGRPADSRGMFFKRKTSRRRSPASEDKRIFGKYQRKARKEHGKH